MIVSLKLSRGAGSYVGLGACRARRSSIVCANGKKSTCRILTPMLGARLTRRPATSGDRQSGRSSGVEHNLAKVGVEGSNPFARSSLSKDL